LPALDENNKTRAPALMANWAGLRTIAAELGKDNGKSYSGLAKTAKACVDYFFSFHLAIFPFLENSEIFNTANTYPWLLEKKNKCNVFMDSTIFHPRRPLAVSVTNDETGDAYTVILPLTANEGTMDLLGEFPEAGIALGESRYTMHLFVPKYSNYGTPEGDAGSIRKVTYRDTHSVWNVEEDRLSPFDLPFGIRILNESDSSRDPYDRPYRQYREDIVDFESNKVKLSGPWTDRLAYAAKMQDHALRSVFIGILASPWNLKTHERIAKTGGRLMTMGFGRPRITQAVSSGLVCRSGKDTMIMGINHTMVTPSREAIMGWVFITAEMHLGVIPTNPHNVAMFPFIVPESQLGGMGTSWMTNPEQFFESAQTAHDCFAVAWALSETEREYPMALTNNGRETGPDDGNFVKPLMMNGSGDFWRFTLRSQIDELITMSKAKINYYQIPPVSLNFDRGPTWYYNAFTGKFDHLIEGTGGRGRSQMNSNDAHRTFDGLGYQF